MFAFLNIKYFLLNIQLEILFNIYNTEIKSNYF